MEIVVEEEDTHHMVEVEVVERGLQVEMGRLDFVVLTSVITLSDIVSLLCHSESTVILTWFLYLQCQGYNQYYSGPSGSSSGYNTSK